MKSLLLRVEALFLGVETLVRHLFRFGLAVLLMYAGLYGMAGEGALPVERLGNWGALAGIIAYLAVLTVRGSPGFRWRDAWGAGLLGGAVGGAAGARGPAGDAVVEVAVVSLMATALYLVVFRLMAAAWPRRPNW